MTDPVQAAGFCLFAIFGVAVLIAAVVGATALYFMVRDEIAVVRARRRAGW